MINNPPSNSALAEQLCRIEHKLDLLLLNQCAHIPEAKNTPLNSPEHLCPVCLQNPSHYVDIFKGHVVRTCGCSTGKLPNNALAPGITIQGTNDGE
jgi:hypothetical protein